MVFRIGIIQRNLQLLFEQYSRTTDWLWISSGCTAKITPDDLDILGQTVFQCLAKSKLDIAPPKSDEHRKLMKPFLDSFGVKSWAELVKGSKYVGVELEEGVLTFEPYKNLGAKGGFEPIPEKERLLNLSSVTEAEIGQALLDAFEDAE